MMQRYKHSDLPITDGDDICSLLLVMCFESIEIKMVNNFTFCWEIVS